MNKDNWEDENTTQQELDHFIQAFLTNYMMSSTTSLLYTHFLCHNCKRRISQFSSFVSNNYIIHPLYYCNREGSMVQRIIILESDKNKTMNDCAKRSEQLFSIIAACWAEQYVWILTPDVINGIMMVVGSLHQSLLLLVIVILSYLSCLQILSLSHWWIFYNLQKKFDKI